MNTLQQQHTDALDELAQYYRTEAFYAAREARRSIRAARGELDRIEAELLKAETDQEFDNIGEIRGVDAGLVFNAFGQIDNRRRCEAKAREYRAAV